MTTAHVKISFSQALSCEIFAIKRIAVYIFIYILFLNYSSCSLTENPDRFGETLRLTALSVFPNIPRLPPLWCPSHVLDPPSSEPRGAKLDVQSSLRRRAAVIGADRLT